MCASPVQATTVFHSWPTANQQTRNSFCLQIKYEYCSYAPQIHNHRRILNTRRLAQPQQQSREAELHLKKSFPHYSRGVH